MFVRSFTVPVFAAAGAFFTLPAARPAFALQEATSPPDAAPGVVETQQAPVPEPQGESRARRFRLRVGPQVGVFLPTDSKTSDRFGDSWYSIGIGIGQIVPALPGGRLEFDMNILTKKRALVIPLGLGYRRAFSGGSTRPYVGVSANLVLADLRSPQDNVRSGMRAGGGGSVFIGTTLSDDGFIEARYLAASRVRGFDLSGLNLTAGARF
jgi:hypothetical protein